MNAPIAMNCPSCGSPLEILGTEAEIQCKYCGNTVAVPSELREKIRALDTEQVVSEIERMRGGLFRQFGIVALIWLGGFAVLFALILIAAFAFQLFSGNR